jgi:peroxiredoxin Q/BCP
MAIEENESAPAFTLQDDQGRKVSLSELRGRDVILYFYPKDDTPGCTKEACGFRDLWREIEKRGATVLGISPDAADSHQKFRAKYQLPFPLLCDPDREVMEQYGAWGPKMMYGKQTIGVIRSTVWIDGSGKVKKHWKRVSNAAEHPAKVLEGLRSASASAR